MYCSNCGKKNEETAKFCYACGGKMVDKVITDNLGLEVTEDKSILATEIDCINDHTTKKLIGKNDEETLRRMIGKKSDYYIEQFYRIEKGEKGKFNPRILLIGVWMPYRKMYKEILPTVIPIIGPFYGIYLFVKGVIDLEKLYYESIKLKLSKHQLTGVIYGESNKEIQDSIDKLGGTSILGIIGYFVLNIGIYLIGVFLSCLVMSMMVFNTLGQMEDTTNIPTSQEIELTNDKETDINSEEKNSEQTTDPLATQEKDKSNYLSNEEIVTVIDNAFKSIYTLQSGYDYDKPGNIPGYTRLQATFNNYDKIHEYISTYWSKGSAEAFIMEMSDVLIQVDEEYYLALGDPPLPPQFSKGIVVQVRDGENEKYVSLEVPSFYGAQELMPYEVILIKEDNVWKMKHELAGTVSKDQIYIENKDTNQVAKNSNNENNNTNQVVKNSNDKNNNIQFEVPCGCFYCLSDNGMLYLWADGVNFECLDCGEGIVWENGYNVSINPTALNYIFSSEVLGANFGGRGDGQCPWCGAGPSFSIQEDTGYTEVCLNCGSIS